jgi:hypothetical protein
LKTPHTIIFNLNFKFVEFNAKGKKVNPAEWYCLKFPDATARSVNRSALKMPRLALIPPRSAK